MKVVYFITLLTLIFYSCEKNVNESASTNTTTPSSTTFATKKVPLGKALILANVDQLRIRDVPSLKNSSVIVELSEGDSLYYLNTSTVNTLKLELRGQTFDRPWLQVETIGGTVGWTYGGGVTFNH